MTWHELMTQTGLGTMLAYGLACIVAAFIVWNWGQR